MGEEDDDDETLLFTEPNNAGGNNYFYSGEFEGCLSLRIVDTEECCNPLFSLTKEQARVLADILTEFADR